MRDCGRTRRRKASYAGYGGYGRRNVLKPALNPSYFVASCTKTFIVYKYASCFRSVAPHILPVFSAAMRVEPEPRKRSRTMSSLPDELTSAFATNSTGFMVGCKSLMLGRFRFHTLLCERSPIHLPVFFSFQP